MAGGLAAATWAQPLDALEEGSRDIGCPLDGAPFVPCDGSDTIITFEPPYVETNERRPTCAVSPGGGQYFLHSPQWVKFVASAGGARVDNCQDATADVDAAVVAVYGAISPDQPLTCLNMVEFGCEPINCGPDAGSSSVIVPGLVIGKTYAAQVAVFRLTGDACLAPPFNCRTAGDYKLRVTCDEFYNPCQLDLDPDMPGEGEMQPKEPSQRINDGCNQSPPRFGLVACGQSLRGTTWLDSGTGDRDTDWYRLVLPEPAAIQVSVIAEFRPEHWLLRPGSPSPCVGPQVLAGNDPGAYERCSTQPSVLEYAAEAGEYWVVVAPLSEPGVFQTRPPDYVLSVNATPCVQPVGACCTGVSCTVQTAAACAGSGQVFYGIGSTCQPDTCFECPAGATPEGENINCAAPHGFADSINGGCGWSTTTPTFINLGNLPTSDDPGVFAARRCGTTATFFDVQPPSATENRRDNDYYRLNLSGVSIGDWRRIRLTLKTEFEAQVLIVNPDLGFNPCPTFMQRVVADVVVQPGIETTVSACVVKRSVPQGQLNLYSDVWALVRPFALGPPWEVPCARRYYLGVQVQSCGEPLACCIGSNCSELAPAACVAQGGVPLADESCVGVVCGPAVCGGDSDCDGDVDFDDIDFFVAALGGEAAWIAHHQAAGGSPNCLFAVNDTNNDGSVTFDDIELFVLAIGRRRTTATRLDGARRGRVARTAVARAGTRRRLVAQSRHAIRRPRSRASRTECPRSHHPGLSLTCLGNWLAWASSSSRWPGRASGMCRTLPRG